MKKLGMVHDPGADFDHRACLKATPRGAMYSTGSAAETGASPLKSRIPTEGNIYRDRFEMPSSGALDTEGSAA